MPQVSVLALNILLGGRRGTPLHQLVRAVDPDVLVVSEAPKRPVTWRRDVRRLASRLRMEYVAGGRPAGDNMILVRPGIEVRSVSEVVMPTPRFQPRRGVVSAQLKVRGELFAVTGCHLTLQDHLRMAEVRRVLAEAARLRGPGVLAGDLNEEPQGSCWRAFEAAGWTDPGRGRGWPTFPSDEPRKRIDALFTRGALVVDQYGDPGVPAALQAAASDHRGVLADLSW